MEQDVMMYIDDVLVFSKSFESHVKTLRKVLTRFREYNLKASPAKCEFAKKSIVFLGHEISETNYSPNQANLDAIEKMPIPRDLRAVHRFVGMAGFFRKFIKHFSEIAEPLTKLTRKEQQFEWTREQQQAFEILKGKLTSKPILAYPDYTKEFHIYTDASAVAQGAVLAQVSANEGNIQVVAYGSRTLSEVETCRPAIQIELGAIVFALRHFKPYIWLSKIILHTDHRPLVHILAKSKVNERIARWLIEIQQYDITIVHIDGKKNTVADCISRAKDEVAPLPTEELEDIIEFPVCMAIDRSKDRVPKKFTPGNTQKPVDLALEQDKDSDVNIIKTFLTSPATTIDGISEKWLPFLERVRMSETGILTVTFGNDNPKVVIPHTLQKLMFESFHTSLLGGGHFDWRKTLHKAQKKYFWPGMRADFLKWTLECLKCQQKRNPHPSKREPQLVVVTSQVFEKVGIDLTGPLRTSVKSNKYYINMICWFSKFVISVPLPDATCETISRAVLKELVLKFGTPNQIVSDNASSFTSAAFQQFCSLLEIGHHRAIPHHSKGNGATERTFRTFHAVISKYINKEHSDWDTILPFTTFSYNNTVHSTTGETPFFLVFGRDPTLTIDRIIDPAPATKKTDIGWFKESLTTTLREVWKQAATRSREAQATYQNKANERANGSDIRPGDRVMYKNFSTHKGLSRKLILPWRGDFRVVEVDAPKATIYDRQHPMKPEKVVHLDQIKKIYEAEDERKMTDDKESDDEMFDENQETSDKSGNFETDRRMTSDEVNNKAKLTQKAEKNKKSRQIEENRLPNMAPAKETTAATMDEKETKNARRNPQREKKAPARVRAKMEKSEPTPMAEETSLDDMVAPPAAEDVVDKVEDSAITPDDVEMADDRDGSTDSDEPAALSSGLRSRTAAGSDGLPVAEDTETPIEINPKLLKENKITDSENPLLADAEMLDNSFEDMPPVDEETEKEYPDLWSKGTAVQLELPNDDGFRAVVSMTGFKQRTVCLRVRLFTPTTDLKVVETLVINQKELGNSNGAQGREYDYVFVLTSRTSGNQGFLDDSKRINVALSRTKIACIVLDERGFILHNVEKIPRALHEGHVDPYRIRYVSILPRIHAPSIYIPSSPTPAWIHGDRRQNNPRSLHGGAWIYIGSYMDPIHVPSVSDPFWHYLPPPVTKGRRSGRSRGGEEGFWTGLPQGRTLPHQNCPEAEP
uniref:RNA-directed DNA polymerase n=1 Tax=Caenorhabditis japonica TaxID=281687 RepID=A0A8R1HMZ2_CAEJA